MDRNQHMTMFPGDAMTPHHKDPERQKRIAECMEKNPELTKTQIAERFGVDCSYVTKAVKRWGKK